MCLKNMCIILVIFLVSVIVNKKIFDKYITFAHRSLASDVINSKNSVIHSCTHSFASFDSLPSRGMAFFIMRLMFAKIENNFFGSNNKHSKYKLSSASLAEIE